jgi:hypothetical protein
MRAEGPAFLGVASPAGVEGIRDAALNACS